MAPQRSYRGRDAGNHFRKCAIGLHAVNMRFSRACALRTCQQSLFLELAPHDRSKAPTGAVASGYETGCNKDYECNLAYGFTQAVRLGTGGPPCLYLLRCTLLVATASGQYRNKTARQSASVSGEGRLAA